MSYRTTLIALILLLTAGSVYARESLEVTGMSADGFSLVCNASPATLDTLYAGSSNYLRISLTGFAPNAEPGFPGIPEKVLVFAAPRGVIPAISVEATSTETFEAIRLAPIPTESPDPSGLPVSRLAEDEYSYAFSGYRPAGIATLGRSWNTGGVTLWELHLTPVSFDAAEERVSLADGFSVTVEFGTSLTAASGFIPDYVVNRSAVPAMPMSRATRTAASQSPFASGDWYRIQIVENGMYRIPFADLQAAGFPATGVDVDDVAMYYGGGLMLNEAVHEPDISPFREMSIEVIDADMNGMLNAGDSIVFYGQSLNRFEIAPDKNNPEISAVFYQNYAYGDRDTSPNVYWLTTSSLKPGVRIQPSGTVPDPGVPATTTYPELLHVEPENLFGWIDSYGQEGGLDWFWATIGAETEQFSFNAPDIASSDVTLTLGLTPGLLIWETTGAETVLYDHGLDVTVNTETLPQTFVNLRDSLKVEYSLAQALNPSNNMLRIRRLPTWQSEVPGQNVRLDYIELAYRRQLLMHGEGFEFIHAGIKTATRYVLAGSSATTVVYNTTDPYRVKRMIINRSGDSLQFQIPPSSGVQTRIVAWDAARYRTVTAIEKKTSSNLRDTGNAADYVVISHPDFMAQAERLAAYRHRDSSIDPLRTMAINVADIYDEFSWGVFDPVAIRDFLQYAYTYYNNGAQPIRYCCLLGDTIYKYKNLSAQSEQIYIPSYTTVDGTRPLITDDFFTWFGAEGTHLAALAIGRLCAATPEEAKTIVDKIIDYEEHPEPGSWHNRALLIADDEYGFQGKPTGDTFASNMETIDRGHLPLLFERDKLLMIEYPMNNNHRKPEASERLFDSLNNGCLFMNYIGHGNHDVLAHEEIFRGSRDINLLNNGSRLPVYLFFSCSVGRFDNPENLSLAEMLQLRKNGGGVAVIAASRVTYNQGNVMLNEDFYDGLFATDGNPDYRIGRALQYAKNESSTNVNTYRYILFGDPACRLMFPRNRFATAAPDTISRLENVSISGSVAVNGTPSPFTGTLSVTAQGPLFHKVYKLANNATIRYTMPGPVFYRGVLDVTGDGFTIDFVVPKDMPSDIDRNMENQRETTIFLYGSGNGIEALDSVDSLFIAGFYPQAPEDTTPPDIRLSFDGKPFRDGTAISRIPTLSLELTDASGINVVGTRGHNIMCVLDKTESIALTDVFTAKNGYDAGTAEYQFPMLSPGEHTLEFSAYDTYNNLAKTTVTAQVVGSESGDVVIQNLLNYPNPMAREGTTFTFDLNDDTSSANIKVYSLSGRLVDTIRFSAGYGFNRVPWTPSLELANGVYFYKLSVVSMNGRPSTKTEKLVVMR